MFGIYCHSLIQVYELWHTLAFSTAHLHFYIFPVAATSTSSYLASKSFKSIRGGKSEISAHPMSSTVSSKVDPLVEWLDTNAFWRHELVVQTSKHGGLGVFLPPDEEEQDPLLLRIPKSNILSSKNSFIYNLIVEYSHSDEEIDISHGMLSLCLSVIYELSIGNKSPWFAYLNLIDFEGGSLPLCLWDAKRKDQFKNTDVNMLNLFQVDEMVAFYIESCLFAHEFASLVAIPKVFDVDIEGLDQDIVLSKYSAQLNVFGKYNQCVISRAFKVDDFHDLCLVPGADLFNHIDPIYKDGQVEGRENIHFECDGDVCEECGDEECDHQDDDVAEDGDDEQDDSDSGEDMESDEELPEVDELEVFDEPLITEITLEYISKIEEELDSEAETNPDPEEAPTDDEGERTGAQEDLAKELSDSSKCCDVVLVRPAEAKYGYEIFNSYGNDLSNAYLLQKYGFVTQFNVNDTCLLAVQLFKYIDSIKKGLNKEKQKQLEDKFEWFEEVGFEVVNELIAEKIGSESHCHKEGEEGCEDDDCGDCEPELELPESWQLSPRIQYDGTCTPQTYATLQLINLDYKIFKHKILATKLDRKLAVEIEKHLLGDAVQYNATIKKWCQERLKGYTAVKDEAALLIIALEKRILEKYIKGN